jgi:hypothetical protein
MRTLRVADNSKGRIQDRRAVTVNQGLEGYLFHLSRSP